MRVFAGVGHGMSPVWIRRSRGEAGRRRYRSGLCLFCHDAVTTPIPVASARSYPHLTASPRWRRCCLPPEVLHLMARGTKNGAKSGCGTTAMTRSSSISMASTTSRADYLRQVPAAVRLTSAEPRLGPVDQLSLDGLHGVITGGESGARHWRRNPAWVRDVRDRCVAEGVADFHKQWGGRTPEAGGRILDGRTWDELPAPSTPQAHTRSLW